ncbi:hypothetical protein PoB_007493600 [Plakobranchus ocellatus]|uniref:Uncharacterized protein n=1 Tax=Plakobranchus ocellatus TaxID=259542 RepID=A0AAV4DX16_9GAST|nr:hypothetical protein PoB_007493600 [Plakobranchus ocellatus]
MEVILTAAEEYASSADLGGGCYMPLLKVVFMGDNTTLYSKGNKTCRKLDRLGAIMNLGQTHVQTKEISKPFYEEKQIRNFSLKVASQDIPRICQMI